MYLKGTGSYKRLEEVVMSHREERQRSGALG